MKEDHDHQRDLTYFPEQRHKGAVQPVAAAPITPPPRTRGDLPPAHPNDPKQEAGAAKIPFHTLPLAVMAEDAVAHGEGALKYGRHNWREGEVLASTYFAAALRHLFAWYEGEDIDPDSGLSHLVKARASLGVLRDAQIQGTAIDDRPRPSPAGFMAGLNQASGDMARRVHSLKKTEGGK